MIKNAIAPRHKNIFSVYATLYAVQCSYVINFQLIKSVRICEYLRIKQNQILVQQKISQKFKKITQMFLNVLFFSKAKFFISIFQFTEMNVCENIFVTTLTALPWSLV